MSMRGLRLIGSAISQNIIFKNTHMFRSLEATPVHFNQYLREMDPYRNKINLPNGPCSFIVGDIFILVCECLFIKMVGGFFVELGWF